MTDFSYQLYSSRNFAPWPGVFQMLKGAGLENVEGFGALYDGVADARALRAELDSHGLKMPTGHINVEALEADPGTAAGIAEALGMDTILVPYLAEPDRPTDSAGWRAFGDRLATIGSNLRARGFNFGYHNHDFELDPTPTGDIPLDLILQADPGIGWEADLAWVVRGGADPAAWVARYADQLIALHIKDIAPAGECTDEDGWADIGEGTLDWPGLLTAVKATGCGHFILEHDNPSDDARFATRSMAALNAMESAT